VVNNNIQAGTIMVEESLLLPEGLRPETDMYDRTWRIVKDIDGFEFDRGVRNVGWNFFFVEGRIRVLVMGWRRKAMMHRAVNRFLATVKSRWFNSAEITSVASGYFLGIPYITLSGHSRQIQESAQLPDAAGRQNAQKDAAWACR
jgi:hypothetical protein